MEEQYTDAVVKFIKDTRVGEVKAGLAKNRAIRVHDLFSFLWYAAGFGPPYHRCLGPVTGYPIHFCRGAVIIKPQASR